MDTYSAPTRAITNTETESTVIGPQDAFTESLETNISLVRRRIQSAQLKK
ncbi:spore germination protein [Lysinibacillus sp. MHQ-1]|nr:spore germination protein [Lysinibacillus sp. MHQ-1]